MKARQWFRFENKAADPAVAEIHISDAIGSWDDDWIARNFGYDMGVTARAFVEQLAQLPDAVTTIRVHINSPGGDVMAGVQIANALREQQLSKSRTVETYIDGIAASIASVIAMAGSKVVIGDNALMMIHNPYMVALGTASDLRKSADVLDTIRGQIINTYRWHSSLEVDAIAALLDAETWMNADEAIANGFATDKVEGLKAAASISPNAVAQLKVPDRFKSLVKALQYQPDAPAPAPVAADALAIVRECKAAGCDELAESLIESKATAAQVTAKVTTAKAAKKAAADRETDIRAICKTLKHDDLAESYVTGGMSPDAVRAQLVLINGKVDRATGEIDTTLGPDAAASGTGSKARLLTTAEIYAQRNATPKE